MPVKFVVQLKRQAVIWDRDHGMKFEQVWIDTQWDTIALARAKWPNETYREVMTEW